MKTKRRLLIAGIVIGSLLTLAPVFGLLRTAFGMMRAFATLGDAGISNPEALANEIGVSLVSTATGLVLFPLGIIVLTLSLVFFFQFRAKTPPPLPPRL